MTLETLISEEELVALYMSGEKVATITKLAKIGTFRLYKILRNHGIEIIREMKCPICGVIFTAKRRDNTVCSHACRMKRWHRRMRRRGRCHWCGKPAIKYTLYCPIHQERVAGKNTAWKRRKRRERKQTGLCPECGKHPPLYGYEYCWVCQRKHIEAGRLRRQPGRERTIQQYYSIVDAGYISVTDAAWLLGLHRVMVHELIKRGKLRVCFKGLNRFWLRLLDVQRLKTERGWLLTPTHHCGACGHEWHLQASNHRKVRCPRPSCRSFEVTPIFVWARDIRKL